MTVTILQGDCKETLKGLPDASVQTCVTFPPDLIEPCILAGSAVGDTVLDPFGGSGTTAMVAIKHGRNAILCELNADYIQLIEKRVGEVQTRFA